MYLRHSPFVSGRRAPSRPDILLSPDVPGVSMLMNPAGPYWPSYLWGGRSYGGFKPGFKRTALCQGGRGVFAIAARWSPASLGTVR